MLYSHTDSLAIFYMEEETDKEYYSRIKRQKKIEDEQEVRDKAQLMRL